MRTFQLAMRGTGHQKNGLPCQDKTIALCKNGATCIALADGAGSAPLSHFGAEAAVRVAADEFCRSFEEFYGAEDSRAVRLRLIGVVREKLEELATEHGASIKDFASTLLFVAQKDNRYIAGQLGDGYMAFLRSRETRLVAKPEKGEFANVTYFTTSPDAEQRLKLFKGEVGAIAGFFLMSDGAAESLYQRSNGEFAPLVGRLVTDTFCKNEKWMCHTLEPFFETHILSRTIDDCSIAILSCCSNYMEFFDTMDRPGLFRLFYKSKYIHREYTDDYINILLHAEQTEDLYLLSQFTGLELSTLKRRIRRLCQLGFHEAIKFKT